MTGHVPRGAPPVPLLVALPLSGLLLAALVGYTVVVAGAAALGSELMHSGGILHGGGRVVLREGECVFSPYQLALVLALLRFLTQT